MSGKGSAFGPWQGENFWPKISPLDFYLSNSKSTLSNFGPKYTFHKNLLKFGPVPLEILCQRPKALFGHIWLWCDHELCPKSNKFIFGPKHIFHNTLVKFWSVLFEISHLRDCGTDRWMTNTCMDGQPKNIMPPAPKDGGGIKILSSSKLGVRLSPSDYQMDPLNPRKLADSFSL